MPTHTIAHHECINSIAARYGFHWRDVWEHPDNQAIRELRKNPNLLCPGDTIAVPTPRPGSQSLASGQQHRMVVRVGAKLRIRLQDRGEPISGAYVLEVGGRRLEGELDGEGQLEQPIPATATRATLLLVERNELVELLLGDLDPADTPVGAIERLVNLGLFTDRSVRTLTPEVRHVLLLVQREEGLEATGELDEATADVLVRWHGC
jgi:hypothetical protein